MLKPVRSHAAAICTSWRRDRDLWEMLGGVELQSCDPGEDDVQVTLVHYDLTRSNWVRNSLNMQGMGDT